MRIIGSKYKNNVLESGQGKKKLLTKIELIFDIKGEIIKISIIST